MSIFRTKANATVAAPQYTGLQVQTASSALPIPIVYGQTRVAPNLLWANNFQTHAQYSQQHTSGKGGGGTQATLTGYTYSTAVIFGVCEGPVTGIGTVFRAQGQHSLADYVLGFYQGTTPQAPWGYLTASYPSAALGYQGTAFAASSSFDLGASAAIDSLAFEVYGRFYTGAGLNTHDADPALVIGDFLTNAQYGVGFPAASLDATTLYGASGGGSYQTYCQALGLAFSPALTDQESANTTLARWLQITNSAAVWSGGRLKIIPFGDAPVAGIVAGAAVTFQPNATPVYDLGDDDYVYDGSGDPVTVARLDPYAAANLVRLEVFDRANQYSATPVEARDQNAIELYGLRIASTITAHEICDTGIASIAAQLILQRGLYIRNSYSFRLSWDYCLLEPMDLVTLTDTGLGLAKTPVRIVAIEEDASGLLTVTAEEYPGAVGAAVGYPVSGAVNTPINRNVAVAAVNPPVIFEPPSDLTGGVAQIWVGLSGGTNGTADPNWGGATVYISTDNVTYAQIATLTTAARQGLLTQALPSLASASPSDRLSVGVAESAATLSTVGVSASNPSLCLVDAEIIAYTAASLSAASTYTLSGLQRAFYGQQGKAHAAGAPFLCLDNAVFRYTLPATLIGQTLYLKFASFNVFGGAAQDLSTCGAYTIKPIGSGVFGPVAQAITQGSSLDEGLASLAVSESDSYGLASDPYTEAIDMGLASDGAAMLAVASGGTGAASASAARANIGAAAAGANTDITSLGALTALGINTAADPVNKLSAKSAAILFDNIGAGMQMAVNKTANTDSASLVFQTGYSGRAQAGLLAGDRYRISVSAAGSTWLQAMDIDPATGHVGLAGYPADANNALGVSGTSVLFNASTDSCRLIVNKVATANDATLTFETGFSARALMGLLGSDAFQLKLSADGTTYHSAFTADPATGNLAMAALLAVAPYTVATLPAGLPGALAFASNGRKLGEAAGAGTGVLVLYSNTAWRRVSDDTVVAT